MVAGVTSTLAAAEMLSLVRSLLLLPSFMVSEVEEPRPIARSQGKGELTPWGTHGYGHWTDQFFL